MTVESTINKSGPYAGAGSVGPYTVGFRFLDQTHLRVIKTVDDVDANLSLATDYSVAGVGNPTGSVTLVAPLATGEKLTIIRNVPATQEADYVQNDAFPAESHEAALDKLTMLVQQMDETISRSLTLPPSTSSSVSTQLPPPEANFVIGWNEAEDALINVDPASFATIVAYGTTASDLFSGNGAQTAFTLTHDPASVNNMDVAVGGVTQRPGLDYTWSSGTTMTFTTAPPAGTNNILVRYQLALPIGSSDSSSSLFIQSGAGAVVRTAQDKMRESFSVKDFGAIGDGVANDTAAVSATIAAAIASGSKGVYAPAGVYKLTAPISAALSGLQQLTITGDGSDATEFRFVGAANGFAFTAAAGNWWLNVSPGNGFKFEGFSVTTDNVASGTGFAVNGGCVTGRPARKTTFTDVTFRGASDFSHSWATHTQLTDCGGVWFNSCRWLIGGSGNLTNVGVNIVGTPSGNPSGYFFNHCEAFYGATWITAGNNVEGIYLTQCAHVAGARAMVWTATAESGLHVIGGHYNNTIVNFALNGVFDYEIVGALLYCDGHGASFTFITAQNGGQGTIVGNAFVGQNSGSELGVLIDNTAGGARYGITVGDNSFGNIAGYGVQLGANAKYVTVGTNGYNACSSGDVNNLGTNNLVAKRRLAFTTVITMTGGSPSEVVNITLPAGIFIAKPSAASITGTGTGIIGFYDYDSGSSTSTNLRVTMRDINASAISAGATRFSVIVDA